MYRASLFAFFLTLLAGCAGASSAAEAPLPPDADTQDLVIALERDGYIPDSGPFRLSPLLDAAGQELRVGRSTLHVFEYPSAQAAADDVGDLGVVTAPVPATVYRSGRLAVIFFGTDTSLQVTLAQLLGPAVL
jgi:hypothetical protein